MARKCLFFVNRAFHKQFEASPLSFAPRSSRFLFCASRASAGVSLAEARSRLRSHAIQ